MADATARSLQYEYKAVSFGVSGGFAGHVLVKQANYMSLKFAEFAHDLSFLVRCIRVHLYFVKILHFTFNVRKPIWQIFGRHLLPITFLL